MGPVRCGMWLVVWEGQIYLIGPQATSYKPHSYASKATLNCFWYRLA